MTGLHWLKAAMAVLLFTLAPLSLAVDTPQESEQELSQVDINAADAMAIAAALDGIGIVKAEQIVAYREKFGKFRSIDELAEVKGIGIATVAKNKHRIILADN